MNPLLVAALLTAYVAGLSLVVGIVPSTRLRAVIYSIPIPMSMLSLLGPELVDPDVIIGLIVNASFFWLVAFGDKRGWWRWVSTAVAAGVYVATSWLVTGFTNSSLITAVALSALVWLVGQHWVRRVPVERVSAVAPVGMRRLVTVFVTAAAAVSMSGILGPFLVTFPYTGITMALTYPGSTVPFARSFWLNGLPALLGYGIGLVTAAQSGLPMWACVLVALGCWFAATGIVAWLQRRSADDAPTNPALP